MENWLTRILTIFSFRARTDKKVLAIELARIASVKQAKESSDLALADFIAKDSVERSLQLLGEIAVRSQSRHKKIKDLSEVEFKVFSQWGEDGIIAWLVEHAPYTVGRFIEFGVENFREANCRFLMHQKNWKGLVFDGSQPNIEWLKEQPFYWMHDLSAVNAFITADNINKLIVDNGFAGPVGILSIDVDGNDYWIWEAIECVDPTIIICEVNPIFGDVAPVSIPYDPSFTRFNAHYSGLYFGASIAALKHLAAQRGYSFIGTNSHGINAFFVKTEYATSVLSLLTEVKSFPSRHRDSRDIHGVLSFASGIERFTTISDMPVVNVVTGATIKLRDIPEPFSEAWKLELS